MSAERLQQGDKPPIVSAYQYSPEHLCHTNGSTALDGNMAGTARSSGDDHSLRRSLQALGKQALEVNGMKKKPGRPQESGSVRVTPIFRNPPDAQKLGRAVLNLVEHMEKMKEQEHKHAA